ncbi:hypothetical protein [Dactylosporangium salmoneum]|uniref:Uncharacterized protein n=1 Tax=Dactylosporangium salmoneum TaxID=53361 RepID=A0ABN3HAD0_9ACTN
MVGCIGDMLGLLGRADEAGACPLILDQGQLPLAFVGERAKALRGLAFQAASNDSAAAAELPIGLIDWRTPAARQAVAKARDVY